MASGAASGRERSSSSASRVAATAKAATSRTHDLGGQAEILPAIVERVGFLDQPQKGLVDQRVRLEREHGIDPTEALAELALRDAFEVGVKRLHEIVEGPVVAVRRTLQRG